MLKWIQKEGKTEFGDNWNRILIDPQTFIIEPPHRIMATVQLTSGASTILCTSCLFFCSRPFWPMGDLFIGVEHGFIYFLFTY